MPEGCFSRLQAMYCGENFAPAGGTLDVHHMIKKWLVFVKPAGIKNFSPTDVNESSYESIVQVALFSPKAAFELQRARMLTLCLPITTKLKEISPLTYF